MFGIIKSALGFRQFFLRGLDKVRAEWSLVTMAWNLKRMFVLARASSGRAPRRRETAAGQLPVRIFAVASAKTWHPSTMSASSVFSVK